LAAKTTFTIEDFERLPSELVKNRELVDRELIDVSGNTHSNNRMRDRILSRPLKWEEDQTQGVAIAEQEYEFLGNVHGPDVSFYRNDKRHLVDPNKRIQRFVPDLAIEIVSDNDTYTTIVLKKDRYLRAGTTEV
jgi:Uma2 family endonuclease